MATTEHSINDALASILRTTRHGWKAPKVVQSEGLGLFSDSSERSDILVGEPNVSPVVVETEVLPAVTVESDARSRLGKVVRANGQRVLATIAVRVPSRFRHYQGKELHRHLLEAEDLEMAVFVGADPSHAIRSPNEGWLDGSISNLSLLVQSASVPPSVINEAAERLVGGVSHAAGLVEQIGISHPGVLTSISKMLRQESNEQTWRMAATILANALVFHETLAHGPGDLSSVRTVDELHSDDGLSRTALLAEWRRILAVNYWPIFEIASKILEVIPLQESVSVIAVLQNTASSLIQHSFMRSHDLNGAVFQRLIVDRKFLAAFYTTPASASLLTGLALQRHLPAQDPRWGEPNYLISLRVADFACGTGTLLSTAYQQMGQLHELHGGNSETIHPEMMASGLVGCDVLPAASHLTASMLSGSHPTVKYESSSVMALAYGVDEKGTVSVGSLDFLDTQRDIEVVAISAKALGGTGMKEEDTWRSLPHRTFDVVIMNPPFTRATGHEGKKLKVHNPMVAAFAADKVTQKLMAKRIETLTRHSAAHGNAGEGSYFLVLADKKLKIGGTLALILPLSLLSGSAWEESRNLLRSKYSQLILVSIAAPDSEGMSFSADTGMGECVVCGVKEVGDEAQVEQAVRPTSDRAIFVVLRQRPDSSLLGSYLAKQVISLSQAGQIRRLEEGPAGGTSLKFGNDIIGHAIDASLPASGPWNPTRIADLELAQAAYQLGELGRLWLPGMAESEIQEIPVRAVRDLGEIGPYHADISGDDAKGGIRGPFEMEPADGGQSTYPILWAHDAPRERTMQFEADFKGQVRQGASREKVAKVWASRSHCHFNQNFQFNSQSTPFQFTSVLSLGGRAWISIKLSSEAKEKALVMWGNTTIGLLLHWYYANKQQSGRGNIVPTALAFLPVLNVDELSETQMKAIDNLFDDLCQKEMSSIDCIAEDGARRTLDERFCTEVLHLPAAIIALGGPVDLLRKKLSKEPSITG